MSTFPGRLGFERVKISCTPEEEKPLVVLGQGEEQAGVAAGRLTLDVRAPSVLSTGLCVRWDSPWLLGELGVRTTLGRLLCRCNVGDRGSPVLGRSALPHHRVASCFGTGSGFIPGLDLLIKGNKLRARSRALALQEAQCLIPGLFASL